MRRIAILLIGLWLLGSESATGQTVIYVDSSATGPTFDGSSWCSAYVDLQDALDEATSCFEIRVAQGTYKPDQGANQTAGDREATFQLIDGVALKGGYAGCGTADPDERDFVLYAAAPTALLLAVDKILFAHPAPGAVPTRRG